MRLTTRQALGGALVAATLAFAGCGMMPGGSSTTATNSMAASQEVPPNGSQGSGTVVTTLDKSTRTLKWTVTYSGLSGPVTAGHFHGPAAMGVNAGVVVPFTGSMASPIQGQATLTEAQMADLVAGKWYANLHTAANPGGEIRGQLSPRVVPMDALQETPVNFSLTSSGFALVAIDTAANTLGYDVHITQLSGAETAAHIHGYASLGNNAGVVQGLALGARKLGTWTYPAANEVDVLLGRTYFNSHTAANPNGEIRGQILFLPGQEAVTAVGDPPRVLPRLSAAPNPFGGRTALSFNLARTGPASLDIMGVDGRVVRRVPPVTFAPGAHSYEWDGLDDSGRAAAPGIYFAVVHTPDGDITTRLARLQ